MVKRLQKDIKPGIQGNEFRVLFYFHFKLSKEYFFGDTPTTFLKIFEKFA